MGSQGEELLEWHCETVHVTSFIDRIHIETRSLQPPRSKLTNTTTTLQQT